MTSRHSFWVSLQENMKRRIWVVILMGLTFFFYFPVCLGLSASSTSSYMEKATPEQLVRYQQDLIEAFNYIVGLNVGMLMIVIGAAIICGLQGFFYLYNRKKVDFYHSQPVSKKRRFAMIYINGIAIYFFTYVIALLMGIAMGSVCQMVTMEGIIIAIQTTFINLLLFMGVYAIAVIGTMLTGNVMVALLGIVVLLGYEFGVRVLWLFFQQRYYDTWSNYSSNFVGKAFTSPIVNAFTKIWDNMHDGVIMDKGEFGKGIVILCAFAVVYTGIALYLYLKRPMESCGKAMAFGVTKTVVKIMILVPTSLLIGIIFSSFGGDANDYLIYVGTVLGAVLMHGVVQAIYEFDVKAILKQKKDVLIVSVIGVCVIAFFQFDLSGYDKYIPDGEKVESVSMYLEDGVYYESYYKTGGGHMGDWEYYNQNMFYADTENILALATIAAQEREENTEWIGIDIQYRMANKSVYRYLRVPVEASKEVMNEIASSQEYKEGYYQILSPSFMEDFPNLKVNYSGNMGNNAIYLQKDEVEAFTAMYQKELAQLTYDEMCSEVPVGVLQFCEDSEEVHYNWNYPVYPSFTETLAYVQKDREAFNKLYVKPEQIAYVVVDVYGEYGDSDEITYKDPEQIDEILSNSIYEQMRDYMPNAHISEVSKDAIQVEAYLKESVNGNGRNYYNIPMKNMPEFLVNDWKAAAEKLDAEVEDKEIK